MSRIHHREMLTLSNQLDEYPVLSTAIALAASEEVTTNQVHLL